MTAQQLNTFLRQRIYKIKPGTELWSRCIDGRYQSYGYLPPLAIPGADAGDLLIAFAALRKLHVHIPEEKVLGALLAIIGAQNFHSHTDRHNPAPVAGCGHVRCISQNTEEYGVTEQEVSFVKNIVTNMVARGIMCDVLEGEHEESAIIVIDSTTHSVAPRLEQNGKTQEVFIYHKKLHQERLKLFAEKLHILVRSSYTTDKFIHTLNDVAAAHLKSTVSILAPRLPRYLVKIISKGTWTIVTL